MDTADDYTFAEDYPLQPLDDDCRLLCSLMDDCIRMEHGDNVMQTIERVRCLAQSYTSIARHGEDTKYYQQIPEKEGKDSPTSGLQPHPVQNNMNDLSEMLKQKLVEELMSLNVEDAITVSRSCGQYLNLSSIAETHHRVRSLKVSQLNFPA